MTDTMIQNIFSLTQNSQYPEIWDVRMHQLPPITQFDSFECHFVIYPYNREIGADDLTIHPFQEYVEDILDNQKSLYTPIHDATDRQFGLTLSLLVMGFVMLIGGNTPFSVEALVSLIGAYIAGKELWIDIERYLLKITKSTRLRYFKGYYAYQFERNTTFTQYSVLARRNRYTHTALVPEQIDYIEQSNSKTVRMYYKTEDIPANTQHAHVFSYHIPPEVAQKIVSDGFLWGVKISLNKDTFWGSQHTEWYQSLDNGEAGCLDMMGKWHKDAVFQRKTLTFSKWKFYKSHSVCPKQRLFVE